MGKNSRTGLVVKVLLLVLVIAGTLFLSVSPAGAADVIPYPWTRRMSLYRTDASRDSAIAAAVSSVAAGISAPYYNDYTYYVSRGGVSAAPDRIVQDYFGGLDFNYAYAVWQSLISRGLASYVSTIKVQSRQNGLTVELPRGANTNFNIGPSTSMVVRRPATGQSSQSLQVRATLVSGITQAVRLQLGGQIPYGAMLSPNIGNPTFAGIFTFYVSQNTARGTYRVTITGTVMPCPSCASTTTSASTITITVT